MDQDLGKNHLTDTAPAPLCLRCGAPRRLIGPPEVLDALGPICPRCNAENLIEHGFGEAIRPFLA